MNQPAYQFDDLMVEEQQEPKSISDLSWVARRIVANKRQADMIAEFKKRELNKIAESCDQRIAKFEQDNAVLESMAANILKAEGFSYESDKKKYEMPSIGIFRFTMTRESVDSMGYDSAPEDSQKHIQSENPDYFRTTVKVAPDKKIIGEALKAGIEIEGFTIKPKKEAFEFKE